MIDIVTAQGPLTLANHKAPPAKGSVMGDNLSPFDAIKLHVDDLEAEALNHLDGKPIENEAQAASVAKLLDDARKARQAAEEQRKIEAKPWDDGKAAVQARWKPLTDEKTGRPAIIAETCKNALAAFLSSQEAAQRAAAQALQEEADKQAEAAAQAARDARPDDLAGQTTARAKALVADEARKAAVKADKARPQAKGGERAVGLRSRWTATVADPVAFARWAWEHRKGEYLTFLETLATAEARHGPRDIPGLTMIEQRTAV